MAKRDFAFGKENFILIAVAVACIVLGFILMSGGGFVMMIFGILKNSKDKEVTE